MTNQAQTQTTTFCSIPGRRARPSLLTSLEPSGANPTAQALRAGMEASVSFLEVAEPRVSYPLWSAMYLAPLAEILEPAFVLWLYGAAGALKSTPPPSVALYVVTTLAVVVGVARAISLEPLGPISTSGWQARVALSEPFITLLLAFVRLGERLTLWQWLGGALLITAGLLARRDSRVDFTAEEWMTALEDEAEKARLMQAERKT